jgi:uridine nucleosidase
VIQPFIIMNTLVNNVNGFVNGVVRNAEKLIIDTDPGIDDSMAILMAFRCPEVEVVGLTTVFGNAATEDSTRNALLLDSVRSQAVEMFLLQKEVLSH